MKTRSARAYESAWAKLKELQRKRVTEQNEAKSVQAPPPVVRNEPRPAPEIAVAAAAAPVLIADPRSDPPQRR
ncbi:MAG TPA: hypothetical protein VFA04_05755 [Bryobacteraceae bacterium]|nr:hypothetical protein [Bryobacteraceae bacterium]